MDYNSENDMQQVYPAHAEDATAKLRAGRIVGTVDWGIANRFSDKLTTEGIRYVGPYTVWAGPGSTEWILFRRQD